MIVFCNCSYAKTVPDRTRQEVLAGLQQSRLRFEAVADLCALAAHDDPRLAQWAAEDPLTIIACYPRAIRWLFARAGVDLPAETRFWNMRTSEPADILEDIQARHTNGQRSSVLRLQKPGSWVPWFPVIDYERCSSCGQCLNFCLFGVYEKRDGRIAVTHPAGCKTNCPACARICPRTAIIFPKSPDRPINGDEVTEAAVSGGHMQADVGELAKEDILDRIRGRSGRRRPFESDPQRKGPNVKKTLGLAELRKQLNIPAEVLESMSLRELNELSGRIRGEKGSDEETVLPRGEDATAAGEEDA